MNKWKLALDNWYYQQGLDMREDLCLFSAETGFNAGYGSRQRELISERDALREALTELCDEIDKHEIHAAISQTNISWFKRKARTALAQGQEQS